MQRFAEIHDGWSSIGLPIEQLEGFPFSLRVLWFDPDDQSFDPELEIFFAPLASEPLRMTDPRFWGESPGDLPDTWDHNFILGDIEAFSGAEIYFVVDGITGRVTIPDIDGVRAPILVNSTLDALKACMDALVLWSIEEGRDLEKLKSVISDIDPEAVDSLTLWGSYVVDKTNKTTRFEFGPMGSSEGSYWSSRR